MGALVEVDNHKQSGQQVHIENITFNKVTEHVLDLVGM